MQDPIHVDSRPLASAEDPILTVVVAPDTVSETDAQTVVDELAGDGLAIEVADHAALSRRGAEQLLELHFILENKDAVAVLLGVMSAAVWDGVKAVFRRLFGRRERVDKVTVVVKAPGYKDVIVEAVGENAAEQVLDRLPDTLRALEALE
jgi:hypothetical protein